MQVDPRFGPNIQNENAMLRQQINRLNGISMTLDEKYQRSLKQMSNIIQANKNLKNELDNLKANYKDQIENSLRDTRANYDKKIEQLSIEKNDLYAKNQNMIRQKQQLQRDYEGLQKSIWENQSLRAEIGNLKKENQKLLVQNLTLGRNQENPEHKISEQKLNEQIEELSSKVTQLGVQNTQNKKYIQSLEFQKKNIQKQVESLSKKNNQLSFALEKAQSENSKESNVQAQNRAMQVKRYQMQTMDLRKQIAELTNQIQRYKLQKLQSTSQINKNEAEIHLLTTLKSLHSQLEPMRYEIEQLRRDKYFDRQNTNKQKAQLQIKLLSAQHQLETHKQQIKDLENKNKELSQQIREKQWEKYRFQELEEEKRILEGRVIVYEAMEMVSRNRDKPHHVERLEQFERRIQILLQQQNLQYLVNNANVHQLIAMKAYVIQLDNKLQTVIEQNQNFHKRYSQYKQKYQQLANENKQIINKHYSMINAYKGKIAGYQKLVIKLTEQLQMYIKDNQGASIQSHYKSVITLYESKILSIYNELNTKKLECKDNLKKIDNIELQFKGKLALIKEMEIQLTNLRSQNKQLQHKLNTRNLEQESRPSLSSIPEDHYKSIITQKTKQILQLEESLSKLKFKIDKMEFEHDREMDDYKHKIARLEMEVEHYRLEQESINKHLSTTKQSQQFGELVIKLSNLQKNVAAMSKSQVNLLVQKQGNSDLERQIDALKYENQQLLRQLDSARTQMKKKINVQNTQITLRQISNQDEVNKIKDMANKTILQLQNRINQLEAELKIKMRESSIKLKQIQRGSIDHSSVSVEINPNKINQVQQQNYHLRSELQKIRASYKSMTIESEGLMAKIRQTQAYISGLKGQFDKVCNKMNEYQRQLNTKDGQLRQSKIKFTNLQSRIQVEVANAKSSSTQSNTRQIEEKMRKIKQIQMDIQRSHRQIQSKYRDIQRRQLQANRRESEIQIKNKDFNYRLRKVEERERIVSEEEQKLIRWANQLEFKEKNVIELINRQQQLERQQLERQQQKKPINQQNIREAKTNDYSQFQKKIKKLSIELEQKLKIIEIKDQKMNKMIRERAEQVKQLEDTKAMLDEKNRGTNYGQRQVSSLKDQITRLQGELEKLWKQYDLLKQQMRNKQRELSDKELQNQSVSKKYEIEIRELKFKIKQFESNRRSQSPPVSPPKNNINFADIDRQFQQKLQAIEERNKLKIREIYKQNQETINELQQNIFDLNQELNRYRNQSPIQNKGQIEAHTATIQSLESHIKSLEDQVRRKQQINKQLEEDLRYYKQVLAQRQQELQKLYDSTYLSSSHHGDGDNSDKIRLQNQIISLQAIIQNQNNHEECIKKQHLLRMEIQRLSGMLQSRVTQQQSEKPQSPRSSYRDNSYLQELEQTNRNLESDLTLIKQRLIAQFDEKRNIDDYLAILVLSFAEIDALRQRVYELEQNFREEHQRQISVFQQLDELKQHNVDMEKILQILKQLEHAHRAFHEEQERSKSTYIKRINTQVLVMPGSQAISISQQLNKNKMQFTQGLKNEDHHSQGTSLQIRRPEAEGKSWDVQRSFKYSLNQGSGSIITSNFNQPFMENITKNQPYFSPSPLQPNFSNPNLNQPFIAASSLSSPNTILSSGISGPQNIGFTGGSNLEFGGNLIDNKARFGAYDGQAKPKIQFNSGSNIQFSSGSNAQFTSLPPIGQTNFLSNRPASFTNLNTSLPLTIAPTPNRYFESSASAQVSPNTRLQNLQPFQFYQPSQGSQSSLKFPSETNLVPGMSLGSQNTYFRVSQSGNVPYMI